MMSGDSVEALRKELDSEAEAHKWQAATCQQFRGENEQLRKRLKMLLSVGLNSENAALQARIAKLRNELDWAAKYLESCGGEDSDPEVQAAKSIRKALAEDSSFERSEKQEKE